MVKFPAVPAKTTREVATSPFVWFLRLEQSRESGNKRREDEAIRKLRALGINVTFGQPQPPSQTEMIEDTARQVEAVSVDTRCHKASEAMQILKCAAEYIRRLTESDRQTYGE